MPERLGGSGEKYATFTRTAASRRSTHASHVTRARDVAARAAERARLVLVRAATRRARELRRRRRDDEARSRGRARCRAGRPRRSSSRPASRRGTPRTERCRSPRPPARSRRRGSARRDRRARASLTRPVNVARPSSPRSRASRSSRSRSGPVAGDDDAQRPASAAAASISRSMRFARSSRLTERMKSSYAVAWYASGAGGGAHAPRRRARSSRAAGRRRSHDVAKIFRASPSAVALEREHLRRSARSSADSGELAELGAVEVPRLAELVQQPHDLARMAHGVRRELRRDHRVDRPAVRLLEIEQPPEERLRQHALAGIPLERHGDELGLVPARRAAAATRSSAKISAPPRSNGTCGRQTASLTQRDSRARRRAARGRRRAAAARR